jgi:hypothetical protein
MSKRTEQMNEKVNTLVEALQADHGPAYALGWLSSILDHIGRDLQLTKKQTQRLHELMDNNIKWAQAYNKG